MHTAADFAQEKSELQSVLASGIFHRAPNLAQVLTYVCSQYFDGAADQIKEYNIAVEALGRPPGFDQKRDSIVRVEVHRLRKRLREYYEAEGSAHCVRIDIPSGQYAPQFVRQRPPQPSLSEEAVVVAETLNLDSPVDPPAAPAPGQMEVQAVAPIVNPVSFVRAKPLLLAPPSRDRAGIWIALALVATALSGAFLWRATAAKPGKSRRLLPPSLLRPVPRKFGSW